MDIAWANYYWSVLTPEQQAIHRAVWDEALSDPAFVAGLEAGIADVAAGRVVPFAEVRMTDDQAKTPKPTDPLPKPPDEPTEPPLEPADPDDDTEEPE